MHWTNIYYDEHLAKKCGGHIALPMQFLKNQEGKVIYNWSAGNEVDFVNLNTLQAELKCSIDSGGS